MRTLAICLGLMAGLTTAAMAETFPKDRIISEMKAQGYESIKVRQSVFGRTKIVGRTTDQARVVTMNPKTGKIFRDVTGPIVAPQSGDTPDGTGLSE